MTPEQSTAIGGRRRTRSTGRRRGNGDGDGRSARARHSAKQTVPHLTLHMHGTRLPSHNCRARGKPDQDRASAISKGRAPDGASATYHTSLGNESDRVVAQAGARQAGLSSRKGEGTNAPRTRRAPALQRTTAAGHAGMSQGKGSKTIRRHRQQVSSTLSVSGIWFFVARELHAGTLPLLPTLSSPTLSFASHMLPRPHCSSSRSLPLHPSTTLVLSAVRCCTV